MADSTCMEENEGRARVYKHINYASISSKFN